uniref:Uncharacterized protein n=1 Tax=Arundo donax TaxID=35708 RepID=A0A0A8ZIN9_ARUDO
MVTFIYTRTAAHGSASTGRTSTTSASHLGSPSPRPSLRWRAPRGRGAPAGAAVRRGGTR